MTATAPPVTAGAPVGPAAGADAPAVTRPPSGPRRRGWGSVRVRVALGVTVLFAMAMAFGTWALVRSVERSLVSQVRADDRATLEMFAAEISNVPNDRVGIFITTTAVPFFIDKEGGVGIARGIGTPGQSTYWALGPSAGEIDPAFTEGAVRTELVVPTRAGDMTLVALTPVSIIDESVTTVRRALLLAVPSLVLLVGVMAWFTTARALRPVGTMTKRVEDISGSNLHERVPVPSTDDEITDLARTMNAMLDRLEDSATRQRRFVSDASHELRSPVAAIRTELEVALLHPDGTDWQDVAHNVLAEDERLARVVADLLTLARSDEQAASRAQAAKVGVVTIVGPVVDAEARRSRRVPVEVREGGVGVAPPPVVGAAADLPAGLPADLPAGLPADLPDGPPATAGSLGVAMAGHDLERVLRHLLDNATRHARARVVTGIGARDGWVRVSVDDDGPGVAPDDRERIFERFGRLDEARTRDAGGAGLGLAVVARLVGAAGGRVWVEDSPLGGARFCVAIPAAT